MPGYCNYFRLLGPRDVLVLEHSSDSLGGLVTVHEWHIAIHKDQRILVEVPLFNGLLDNLYSLFSVIRKFRKLLSLIEA